jgi:hypothetical protein
MPQVPNPLDSGNKYLDCKNKIDFIPPNPVFQHSIIPLPHGIRLWSAAADFL